MPKVVLASALSRWLQRPAGESALDVAMRVEAATIGAALDAVFAAHPSLRGYVLDEHAVVRHHVAIFVDGVAMRDKALLSEPLAPNAEVYVTQALSGG
jgi:molybdopterin synthase sulfur carrier subunit